MKEQRLPDFSAPPLTEVVLSVQFDPLEHLVVPQIGILWQHYGSKYAHVEQHPPIEPVIERLGVRKPPDSFLQFEMLSKLPLPRIWFIDDAERELLQIQQDRFIRNWRQINKDDHYPRYDKHIRPRFVEDYQDFVTFILDNKIGEIVPNQCEVTYTNHILGGELWQKHSEIAKVFRFISPDIENSSPLELEDVKLNLRYKIVDDSEEFIGRLHVSIQPAYLQKQNEPIFVLTLTARGRPLSRDIDGVMGFMDMGRKNIVNTFCEITKSELHSTWGRKDAG